MIKPRSGDRVDIVCDTCKTILYRNVTLIRPELRHNEYRVDLCGKCVKEGHGFDAD